MYPGTIEMAAKIRYDAMVARGQHEQFVALNCVAPTGVWQFPTLIRQWFGSLLVRASELPRGTSSVTRERLAAAC